MVKGRNRNVKFKEGLLKLASYSQSEKEMMIHIDKHVGRKLLDCIEERINKIESFFDTMESDKHEIPDDDIADLLTIQSIRDRFSECLANLK